MPARGGLAHSVAQAAILCGVAGYVDAVGYLTGGHVFAANMTGNTVLLAIAAARGELGLASNYMVALGTFTIAALLGTCLKRLSGRSYVPLLLAALLLVLASATSSEHVSTLALLAAAMGLHGASLGSFSGVSLSTVVVTGTIVKFSELLVEAAWPSRKRDPAVAVKESWHFGAAWLAYAVGAGFGAKAIDLMPFPLIGAIMLMLLTAWDLAVWHRRGR